MGLAAWSADALAQTSVPLEADAIVTATRKIPRSALLNVIDPGVAMIRRKGWRCDSISGIQPFGFSRGFSMICNSYSYTSSATAAVDGLSS